MKKVKFNLGMVAFSVALIGALAVSPKASAVKYWRFTPGQIQVLNPTEECDPDPSTLCCNEYNDAGTQLIAEVDGDYNQ
ncbi:MAG TPA: hypothetical protein VHA52_12430 [Candidatus Babeliaceae bacterium]|nr:hypothetical protein [Candidatus Babeliaceae bacterium]